MTAKISLASGTASAYCDQCGQLIDRISIYGDECAVDDFVQMYQNALCWRCAERDRKRRHMMSHRNIAKTQGKQPCQ